MGTLIEVIDCMNSNRVSKYQVDSICLKVESQELGKEEELMLLQVESEQLTYGYWCSVTSSTFLLYCGVWSHTKLAKVPSIEDVEEVSSEVFACVE